MNTLFPIETVARAMCVADGFDPDKPSPGGPNDFVVQASDYTGYLVSKYGPTWHKYRREANLLLAGLAAARGAGL